jgi:predicted extracellular nuclease
MTRRLLAALLAAGALMALPAAAPAASQDLVISQVYGGGGNSGASHTHDFVEVFNRGTAPVVLDGMSLQYASATGTGAFGANSGQLTELTGTIQPNRYFLVRQAGTIPPVGAPLPAPDQPDDATPINMSGTAGKVALVTGTASLGCNGGSIACDAAALARIVDRIGYGNANFFEGAGAAPALTNSTSAQRNNGGCADSDNNAADFTAAPTAPRNSATAPHSCDVVTDDAPRVTATTPASGAADVARDSGISITFSEDVSTTGDWFSISCSTSGAHPATVSGGPATYTLDPGSDFAENESCTVTVRAANVADADTVDPPDQMQQDHSWSFTTAAPTYRIHEIQGKAHLSPLAGQRTSHVPGVVTAVRGNGFWMQDPSADADPATSEAIFVFTSSAPTVAAGEAVTVSGLITEFRPGGSSTDNLTTTELERVTVYPADDGPAIAPTVVGAGGRVPPSSVIDNDAFGSVESSGTFDSAEDGIDFYESLEGMLLQVNDAVAVGPTSNFGEIFVVGDNGASAGQRTTRGGVVIAPDDFNPERIQFDDVLLEDPLPDVNVGDRFPGATVGVLSYDFSNFELLPLARPTVVSGGLERETTSTPRRRELSVATFNVENLDPSDVATMPRLARLVVENLQSPDLIGIEEMQDNNGETNDGTTDASLSWQAFIDAIVAAGGPRYEFRQINPQNNADGGAPGGNIRVGFLFRTDRGLRFVDRGQGDATTPTGVFRSRGRAHLTLSPGRVDPRNAAWAATRKPLAGEFTWRGETLFAIVNHFSSKGGDDPLFGRWQPPVRSSEVARHKQAASVNAFVQQIQDAERNANVVVLGDINDFEFSETTRILEGDELLSLLRVLPKEERYSYVFEGNSQVLDQILLSHRTLRALREFDVVHVNAEFADQASDHDPSVARLDLDSDSDSDD